MKQPPKRNDGIQTDNTLPEYMKQWPGLMMRQGDRVVDAPPEDVAVARAYPSWRDKGPLVGGKRLTIMTAKKAYKVQEQIRVVHVLDVTEAGLDVYVMGPKPVLGEYVDDHLVTSPVPAGADPLQPDTYDGETVKSPALDYNYDITAYSFPNAGVHRVQWKLGPLRSNILTLTIVN